MTNIEEIRSEFKAYLGAEKFGKFVEEFASDAWRNERLLWWQQREWDKFSDGRDCARFGYEQLRETFLICHVHGDKLHEAGIPIVKGLHCIYVDDSAPCDNPRPYSSTYTIDSDWDGLDSIIVLHCPSCMEGITVPSFEEINEQFKREIED